MHVRAESVASVLGIGHNETRSTNIECACDSAILPSKLSYVPQEATTARNYSAFVADTFANTCFEQLCLKTLINAFIWSRIQLTD